jgi:hypothetical protein
MDVGSKEEDVPLDLDKPCCDVPTKVKKQGVGLSWADAKPKSLLLWLNRDSPWASPEKACRRPRVVSAKLDEKSHASPPSEASTRAPSRLADATSPTPEPWQSCHRPETPTPSAALRRPNSAPVGTAGLRIRRLPATKPSPRPLTATVKRASTSTTKTKSKSPPRQTQPAGNNPTTEDENTALEVVSGSPPEATSPSEATPEDVLDVTFSTLLKPAPWKAVPKPLSAELLHVLSMACGEQARVDVASAMRSIIQHRHPHLVNDRPPPQFVRREIESEDEVRYFIPKGRPKRFATRRNAVSKESEMPTVAVTVQGARPDDDLLKTSPMRMLTAGPSKNQDTGKKSLSPKKGLTKVFAKKPFRRRNALQENQNMQTGDSFYQQLGSLFASTFEEGRIRHSAVDEKKEGHRESGIQGAPMETLVVEPEKVTRQQTFRQQSLQQQTARQQAFGHQPESGTIGVDDFMVQNYSANLHPDQDYLASLAKKYQVSAETITYIKSCFETVDMDKSGYVEFDEFKEVLLKMMRIPKGVDLPSSRLRQYWLEIDTSGDSRVEFEEFLRWWMIRRDHLTPYEEFYGNIRRIGRMQPDPDIRIVEAEAIQLWELLTREKNVPQHASDEDSELEDLQASPSQD